MTVGRVHPGLLVPEDLPAEDHHHLVGSLHPVAPTLGGVTVTTAMASTAPTPLETDAL